MAYNRNQVSNAIDALQRSLTLDAKARAVEAAAKVIIDDDDDLSITATAQVTAYVASRRNARDNLIAAVQPIVAAWTP